MVDHHSVMDGSPSETIIPRWRPVVEIFSSIASQVDALPPQIHVQLICLKRPAIVSAGTDQSPGTFVSKTEVSGFRRRKWRWSGRFCGCWLYSGLYSRLYSEPQRGFIPGSSLQWGAIQNFGS